MITNRLFGSVRQFNYKYIFGELLLIFVGISMSLYFDEWRTDRSDRKKEAEVIGLIIQAVQNDTARLKAFIAVNNSTSEKMLFLLDSSRFEDKPGEKTIRRLSYINVYYQFQADLAAYENLKQLGMTLVTNQALRLRIIKYYTEMDEQQKWTEDIIKGHFSEQLSPYIIDSFVDYQREEEAVPEDFEVLKKDKRFWKLIKRSKMFCDITSYQMEGRLQMGTKLLSLLSEELNR